MGEVDKFFSDEIRAIKAQGKARARKASVDLQKSIDRSIRKNFNNPNASFARGVKIYDFSRGSTVRLSPLLSTFAKDRTVRGTPNLWILLPEGEKLGFKRIGKNFNWNTLKRRYGTKLSFVEVQGGVIVLYRSRQGIKPVYKIQQTVQSKQKIKFYSEGVRIGEQYGFKERTKSSD